MKRALLVTYDPPPIPGWQHYAYHALLAGYDEGGQRVELFLEAVGYGATPRAAVRDLAEQRWHDACRGVDTSAGVRARLRESRGL